MEQLSSTSKCQNYFSCFFPRVLWTLWLKLSFSAFWFCPCLKQSFPCTDIALCFPYCSSGILTRGSGSSWPWLAELGRSGPVWPVDSWTVSPLWSRPEEHLTAAPGVLAGNFGGNQCPERAMVVPLVSLTRGGEGRSVTNWQVRLQGGSPECDWGNSSRFSPLWHTVFLPAVPCSLQRSWRLSCVYNI